MENEIDCRDKSFAVPLIAVFNHLSPLHSLMVLGQHIFGYEQSTPSEKLVTKRCICLCSFSELKLSKARYKYMFYKIHHKYKCI